MALRTIEAPFVEIKEYDKSSYVKSMTGSAALIMGFADHGEDYVTNRITSKASLNQIYGTPTNEAERYFYMAGIEVLDQGGNLYCAKIPYANESASCYSVVKFNIGQSSTISGTALSDVTVSSTVSSFYDVTKKKQDFYNEFPTPISGIAWSAEASSTMSSTCKYVFLSTHLSTQLSTISVSINIDGVSSVYNISANNQSTTASRDTIDKYVNGTDKVQTDHIMIVDKNKTKIQKIDGRECLGIVPVITTPMNALYFQRLLTDVEETSFKGFNPVSSFTCGSETVDSSQTTEKISSEKFEYSTSKEAVSYFKTITKDENGYSKQTMNKIGIVVFQMFADTYNGNKIGFTPVESFLGGFDKEDVDPYTNQKTYIDYVVNSNSQYIYCFSNITETEKINGVKCMSNQVIPILGFKEQQTEKAMSIDTINESIETIFQQNSDIIEKDIDIVCDAGITNIAQFVYTNKGQDKKTKYTPETVSWNLNSKDDIAQWMTLTKTIDTFCHKTRGDCMFIHDGPRNMVLQGSQKVIRKTAPMNTIDGCIIPKMKFITGFETSYTAGYLNWVQIADPITSDTFWCPPSIAAMGVYINCDLNANYWDAPAGLNRGKISVLDLSFNPSIAQAGQIYQKGWNYAINWADVGATIEGQHTLQVAPTAFDRVNVRRLFLRLERQAFKTARYFVYEGNTAYTRQRLVDALDPMFKTAQVNGGIYDYRIVCDETINTPDVIDNNELRVKIGIKPVKTAEFIIIDFIALKTGGSFTEM